MFVTLISGDIDVTGSKMKKEELLDAKIKKFLEVSTLLKSKCIYLCLGLCVCVHACITPPRQLESCRKGIP